ncbi:ABC transporter permease [Halogeometricum luteum]|uniref:ABC transporter permease n=1 Tax=Halogeometricum luteum TaxID=2950537 RepID=A0ABU2G3M9_9EURY|nr:ABC transporter permease subunit [Halogeometricum sp. S3BR5-2]MDS0295397.1 ABC transporter permease [Halogeometricum sp. S3BR5-2]
MQWPLLARTEFQLLVRSKGQWLLFPAILLLGLLIGTPQPEVAEAIGATAVIAGFQIPVAVFGGFGGLLVSYRAVSHGRESGRILLIGSLPFARWEIVVGKVVGRAVAVAVPTLLAVVVGYGIGALSGRVASPVVLVGFLALSFCYLLVTVGIGVSLSTVSKSSRPAVAGIIVYFLTLTIAWVDLVSPVLYRELTGRSITPIHPPADVGLFLLQRSTPYGAFSVASNWLFDVGNSSASFNSVVLQSLPRINTNALLVSDAFGPAVPSILTEPIAVLILSIWLILPLLSGIVLFSRVDFV